MRISKSKFKPQALEFMREVQRTGVPLIITDRGEPVLELRPYGTSGVQDDPLDYFKGTVVKYENPLDPIGEEDWEANR